MSENEPQGLISQALRSSADPKKLSLTVKNALLALVPIIIAALKFYGLEGIDESMITNVIDAIASTVQAGAAFVASVGMAYGLIRKIWNRSER